MPRAHRAETEKRIEFIEDVISHDTPIHVLHRLTRRSDRRCVAIAISYLDRQSLPVAVAAIQHDIPLTNTQFGALTSIFLLAYALMYAGGGALIDRLGTRRGFLLIMIGWSLACASHSLATSFWMLAGSRFLLGAGEGGGFPAATKVIAERFPVERAIDGDGPRQRRHGGRRGRRAAGDRGDPAAGSWRWVFVACGAAGLLWALWWSRVPDASYATADQRRRGDVSGSRSPWSASSTHRQVWGLVGAKFLTDAAWFFYISWLPKYLYDARGFDVKQVGYYAWVPFAASGIGSLLGGWFSSWLITRGRSVNSARKLALGLSAAMMPGHHLRDARPGRVGDRALQHRVLRPAVMVDARHDRADRSLRAPRRRVGRGPGRIRRGDGRPADESRRRPPARSRASAIRPCSPSSDTARDRRSA